MEKFELEGKEYRDDLAEKLTEIRNSNPEKPEISKAKAQGYLEATKETEAYKEARESHLEDVQQHRLDTEKREFVEKLKSDIDSMKKDPILGRVFKKIKIENAKGEVFALPYSNQALSIGQRLSLWLKESKPDTFSLEDAELIIANSDSVPESIKKAGGIHALSFEVDYYFDSNQWVVCKYGKEAVDSKREMVERGDGWPEGSPKWIVENLHPFARRLSLISRQIDWDYTYDTRRNTGDTMLKTFESDLAVFLKKVPPENLKEGLELWKNRYPKDPLLKVIEKISGGADSNPV